MRLGVVLIVAAVAVGAEYRLANIRLPVEVGDASKVPLRPVRLGERLVIVGPVKPEPGRSIFEYKGDAGEAVDIHLENASIAAEISPNFKLNERSRSGRVFYNTDPGLDSGPAPCTTAVEANASPAKSLPREIRFSQPAIPGNGNLRELDVHADMEVLLRTSTFPPDSPADTEAETSDDGPGCAKRLSLPEGNEELQGVFVVQLAAAANSEIKFLFWPLTRTKPMWNGSDGFFEPFKAASPVFQVGALIVQTASGNPTFEITAANPAEPLRINKLKVGSDELLIDISGKGFVTIDGEAVTLNLFERIQKYPLPAGLFLMANAALLAWLGRQVRSLFKR